MSQGPFQGGFGGPNRGNGFPNRGSNNMNSPFGHSPGMGDPRDPRNPQFGGDPRLRAYGDSNQSQSGVPTHFNVGPTGRAEMPDFRPSPHLPDFQRDPMMPGGGVGFDPHAHNPNPNIFTPPTNEMDPDHDHEQMPGPNMRRDF